MQDKVNKLVEWLQQQVQDAGLDGLLVGVSGGVDSAVVAHLIKKAFPENSLAVILPCKSNPGDQDAAQKVIESCGIDSVTVDLTDTHNVLFSTVKAQLQNKNEYNENQERLADANLRARLRMSTLYTLGTNYKYLVVGTDNAPEWYTGYFTKYGDGGVDLVPLLHLTKGEVRELARTLGVPSEIVEKAPSAGLWEGQTDEKELGVSYDTIDKHLKGEEIPEEDEKVIENLHKKTEHKRDIAAAPPKF